MLALFVLLPLVIAAFLALLMRKNTKYMKRIKYVAFLASVITLGLIALLYLNYFNLNANTTQSFSWFTFAGYTFTLTTTTMPLNMLLLGIVGIITPLIIIYSMGFMNLPSEQPRYYFELCLFAAAMLLFAMSGDFITMLIGWELLGITSYLLIGFCTSTMGATGCKKGNNHNTDRRHTNANWDADNLERIPYIHFCSTTSAGKRAKPCNGHRTSIHPGRGIYKISAVPVP